MNVSSRIEMMRLIIVPTSVMFYLSGKRKISVHFTKVTSDIQINFDCQPFCVEHPCGIPPPYF